MIKTLFKLDPCFERNTLLLRFGIPLSAFAAFWSTTTAVPQFHTGGGQDPALLSIFGLILAIFSISTISYLGQARSRVFGYQLALPISARKLVGLRLAAHLVSGLGPLTIVLVCLVSKSPSLSLAMQLFLPFAAFCSAWCFFVLSLFSWRPERLRIDSSWIYLLLMAMGALVLTLPFYAPRLALLLTLPGSGWLAIHLWSRVPRTMSLEEDLADLESPPADAGQRTHSLDFWLFRRAIGQPRFLLLSAGLLYFAMSAQWNLSNILLQSVPMMVAFTTLLFRFSAEIFRDFGHLPMSRRRLAPWILLPPAIILLAGTLLGNALAGPWSTWSHLRKVQLLLNPTQTEAGINPRPWNLQVPGELLQFHCGSEPMLIEGPGGESATLEPVSILWGFPLRLVNPYDVNPENSPEFIAWQLSRALHDAYGITVSPKSLWTQHTERGKMGEHHLCWNTSGATLRSYPVGKLAAGLCLSVLLWTLALLLFTGYRRPPRHRTHWIRRVALWALLGALFLTFEGAVFFFALRHANLHDSFRRALDGTLEIWITSHPWLTSALSLAVLAALSRLGVHQVWRMEMLPPHPTLKAGG